MRGMVNTRQGVGVLGELDRVRTRSGAYNVEYGNCAVARAALVDALVTASRAGASVTELADASGWSRKAVYRALAVPRR